MDLLTVAVTLASSSFDVEMGIYAIPPGVAGAIYYFTYRYYRNQDKRYNYEHETEVTRENVQMFDQKFTSRTGLKKKHIQGRNSHQPTVRVRRVPIMPSGKK